MPRSWPWARTESQPRERNRSYRPSQGRTGENLPNPAAVSPGQGLGTTLEQAQVAPCEATAQQPGPSALFRRDVERHNLRAIPVGADRITSRSVPS